MILSDIEFYNAKFGLIVTTSSFSNGARETVNNRGYPIEEVNKQNLYKWIQDIRSPGRGIIRC
ncbi:restriction endonuclease [Legionella steelei]|uniref:restriction endonuclease n=1 Tax=Legionella steelei TaxID=947033 RepID=UPI0012ECF5D3